MSWDDINRRDSIERGKAREIWRKGIQEMVGGGGVAVRKEEFLFVCVLVCPI